MAAPDTPGNRAPPSDAASLRHPHSLSSFQFVSQLISATPPYLFNMNSPFPGNFFSDLLRRMAPRTPGQPPDASLQQHLRAALLSKGGPPAHMSPLSPQLDLHAHRSPHPLFEDKGLKRPLYSDSTTDSEPLTKRSRIDDREDRLSRPAEGLPAPLLMQPPFLHSSVHPTPDVLSPWAAHASLLRPQVPLPAHLPPPPIDPYRLLLDLRLAGQLRSFGPPKDLTGPPMAASSNGSSSLPPLHPGRSSLPQLTKSEDIQPSSTSVLRNSDDRLSAFHPPGRDTSEQSDEETGERRSHSSSSGCSNASRESLSTQYIFKHLTQIYKTIDGNKDEGSKQPDSSSEVTSAPENSKESSESSDNIIK